MSGRPKILPQVRTQEVVFRCTVIISGRPKILPHNHHVFVEPIKIALLSSSTFPKLFQACTSTRYSNHTLHFKAVITGNSEGPRWTSKYGKFSPFDECER